MSTDKVNHPAHYKARGGPECIEVIEQWNMNYHEGNVVKYLYRAPFKGQPVEDLKKARAYLDRLISRQMKKDQIVSVAVEANRRIKARREAIVPEEGITTDCEQE